MKTRLSIIAILLLSMTYLGLKKVAPTSAPTAFMNESARESTVASPNIAYFSVQRLGRDFQLTWATNVEQKDSRLELEKSFNERQFEPIASFKGADRNALKTYAYMDTTPFERTAHEVKLIYYRLKEVEPNGIFTYSKVVSIVREDNYETPKPTL